MCNDMIDEILGHAKEYSFQEICGVIVIIKGRERYIRCRNISDINSSDHFVIHPEDYANAEDLGEITTIVHSHPKTNPTPSEADLVGIEKSQLPWIIINPCTEQHTFTKPSGYKAPLVGRTFVFGVLDCYSIVKDYYQDVLDITLGEYYRQDNWWNMGLKLYRDNYEKEGFSTVDIKDAKLHDLFLICNGSSEPNHAAIYLGNEKILHHVQGRLSSIDVFGGFWLQNTWKVVRHKSQI